MAVISQDYSPPGGLGTGSQSGAGGRHVKVGHRSAQGTGALARGKREGFLAE